MAPSIIASASTSQVIRAALVRNVEVGKSSSPVLGSGLPKMGRMGRVSCSMEQKMKPQGKESSSNNPVMGGGASLIAAMATALMSSPQAMALVDERMSTEGTGLPFGLSNNLLGWLLLGMFALIWSLYFVYTSGLEEDEESGLSL